jgi:hypothetical protein
MVLMASPPGDRPDAVAGVDPLLSPPPRFDSRAAAAAAYHRIMTVAARHQEMVNLHVVASAAAADPGARARALDAAIVQVGLMEREFRRARDVLVAASPTPLPPAPAVLPQLSPRAIPGALKPRRI